MIQQSCKITAATVKQLREDSGAGMMECKDALIHCGGDVLLAEGYLKYYGCAINTYDLPHEDWAMERAEGFKKSKLTEHQPR